MKSAGKMTSMALLFGACAACCAVPIVALVGGTGVLVEWLKGEMIWAGTILSVAGVAVGYFAIRGRTKACDVNCGCKVPTKP